MRFTLHYEGPLPSRGGTAIKGRIREAFAQQLAEMWAHQPLSIYADRLLNPDPESGSVSVLTSRYGPTFAPIVCEPLGLVAELDIMLLWPAPPGRISRGGDIDNRLKTLFDALAAPAHANQVPAGLRTSPADPQYVLLADDELISRFNVDTDRLLAADGDVAHVQVRVTTHVVNPMYINMSL